MSRLLALLFLLASAALAQESRWKGIEFLFGDWTAGSGKFSFHPNLNGQVVVRKNVSDVDKSARHEDLLVIYADAPGAALRAMYFDSEGHVIRYRVSTTSGSVVFESDGEGPPYRLSYWMAAGELKGKFEVGGRTYLEWSARKEPVR